MNDIGAIPDFGVRRFSPFFFVFHSIQLSRLILIVSSRIAFLPNKFMLHKTRAKANTIYLIT